MKQARLAGLKSRRREDLRDVRPPKRSLLTRDLIELPERRDILLSLS